MEKPIQEPVTENEITLPAFSEVRPSLALLPQMPMGADYDTQIAVYNRRLSILISDLTNLVNYADAWETYYRDYISKYIKEN
jgi:hypothetical protein